ncbi:hypothetical protein J2W20_002356 [Sinomonas atrocyanea]|uniref:hypothetical protein n=1 Tax=Sinomonas atrocyanea TaxID=37927 RepID=UPI002787DD41|nr:hypothetical protein [Sinomonas atrocyanea]MDQ0260452.1 hypothetical protein [Sinomonas atrocyanea]
MNFLERLRQNKIVIRDEYTLRYIARLCKEYPVAQYHRRVFQEMGCDFSYALRDDRLGVWHAVVELNPELQGVLGSTSGIQVTYTDYHDVQPRTIDAMRAAKLERKHSESIYLLYSKDMYAQRKIDEWTLREPYSVLTLRKGDMPAADYAARLLQQIVDVSSRNNPYEITTPVSGAEFFGRHQLLKSLVAEIKLGRVCGVFGLRKTGKTSLLTELGRQFELGDSSNAIFSLHDLEVLPGDEYQKVPQLMVDIANGLKIDFAKHGMRVHDLAKVTRESTIGDFRQAIGTALKKGPGPSKLVVVALDEIESLVGSNAAEVTSENQVPEFFGALRSLVQENTNFNVVISGITTAPILYPSLYGRENPLFAWARTIFISNVSERESGQMIQALGSRMAARWSPEALAEVYRITGGQVFLARSLAGFVAQRLSNDIANREIDLDMVRAANRSWRREAVPLVDGMIDSLSRFYPDELALITLVCDSPDLSSIENDYPGEVTNLLNLNVLEESGGTLGLAPWTQLGSKLKVRNG